ncbi:hypothetical protein F6U93_13945 [Tamlana haliotis]|uniref:Uncharacterized protein n=1 Tax=Pseudotamlana haliotis TaxID=2614804 RepID=A0A6N6MBU8_9FLAO|nr:hypothetical protein [Tamlana haliotis]KAB1066520.1 hypothetical protein F6U93_13945 [Tamlana haliotis]
MKKILYLDNWNIGYRNFLRLDQKFKERGYETLLVHTTSWMDLEYESESECEGMKLRDISYYKTNRIKKIIKQEKPSAILILNLSFILDRAIVKICKDLNINLYYLAHGKLITVEGQAVFKDNMKKFGESKLSSKIKRKNLLSLYNYFIEMKSIPKFFQFFYKAAQNYTQFTAFPKYSEELKVNKSMVYYPIDYSVMVDEFGFPEDNVIVVGNPELDFFYDTKIVDKEEYCLNELKIKSPNYVAYIDDGLSSIRNWDNNRWLDFLKDVNDVLKKHNLELVIKLHPRRDLSGCESFLDREGIKYYNDIDFKNFVHHSLFVFSHFSSVIVYGLLLNKSIKSPRWGDSVGIEENFPHDVVNYYYSKEDFIKDLFNVNVDEEAIKKYLVSEIGTSFDGNCRDRIVNQVLEGL